jgi:general stress protein 26
MATTPDQKLHELLEDFGVAMLVTRTADGCMRARPMALAEAEPGGRLWFATEQGSGKLDEIENDSHVVVTMQSSTKFISLSGRATPVDDREKIVRLWKPKWTVWFPGGKDDPSLRLLRIDGHTGEYWDYSGTRGIKYLIEEGKALLTGSRPDVAHDASIHSKVKL